MNSFIIVIIISAIEVSCIRDTALNYYWALNAFNNFIQALFTKSYDSLVVFNCSFNRYYSSIGCFANKEVNKITC